MYGLFVIFCVVANSILVCLNFSMVKLLFESTRQAETVSYSVSSKYARNGNYVSETYSNKLKFIKIPPYYEHNWIITKKELNERKTS